MTDTLEQQIIAIIEQTLSEQNGGETVSIAADDSMESVTAWDSLSFMSVFMKVNETFGVNPDFDDAIHYTSVSGLAAYLKGQIS
ncbi:MAG: acyl carrier protein [Pseudomonadota bacterium]